MSTPRGTESTMPIVDPHAGFQRPQLLQFLLPLQRRGRQADKALQRPAAIGVEPDVVVTRPLAVGRGGAGEIERTQPPGADHRAHRFDHVGIERLFLSVDFRRQGRDVDVGVSQRDQHLADIIGADGSENRPAR